MAINISDFPAPRKNIFRKFLDNEFSIVLKLSTRRAVCDKFFLEIRNVIRSSIHRLTRSNGSFAGATMRPGMSWMALVCFALEGANYQPKQDRDGDLEIVI